jgi:DNA polymerase-3 subunit delta
MADKQYAALLRHLREKAFERAYYLHGADEYLKEDAVRQLIARAVDPATRDFNLDVRRGAEVDADALDGILGMPPMMAERRVVVIREPSALRKSPRQVLDRYLAHPAADTLLILQEPAGEKADKGLVATTFDVAFAPLREDRLPKWIAHHVATQLGTSIAPEAADLLMATVGSDLPQLAAELDKLASYCAGRPIDEAAVGAVVGVRRGETLGDLLDAIAARDVTRALGLVPHILSQPKTSGVSVVLALTTQMLAIAWGRAARDRGLPAGALEREYFSLLKESSAFPMRPWGEAVGCWARAVPRWDQAACDAALVRLLAADEALKGTRVSSEEQVVASLVLGLCADAARAA